MKRNFLFSHFGKSIFRSPTSVRSISKSSETNKNEEKNSFDKRSTLDECFEDFILNSDHEQQNSDQTDSAVEEVKSTGNNSLHQSSEFLPTI